MCSKLWFCRWPLFITALTFVFCFSACSKHAPPSAPNVSMAESISFEYAIYLLPNTKSGNVQAALRDAIARYPNLKLVDELPKNSEAMLLHAYAKHDVEQSYAPPGLDSLRYSARGLNEHQARTLQHSTNALILDFTHPKKDVWQALRTANELVEELARESGGLVWDQETREVYSPDAWHEKRLASWTTEIPDLSTQTVIHVYPNGEFARAITLGMSKIGLPDVVVQETPWSSDNQVANLINIFSQSIAERDAPLKSDQYRLDLHNIKNPHLRESQLKGLGKNGAGVGCLTLAEAKWEEGDPKNRLIRLASDQYTGDDSHVRQEKMISSFFGSEDSLSKVHHSRELLAESAKEKSKLPELHELFDAGLAPGEFIQVKAPFLAEDGDREWMWVEVTSWKGDRIKGVLNNDPSEVTTLHAGQVVQVREEDVFDYIHQFADKRVEGNTTGEMIRKMSEAASKQNSAPGFPLPGCAAD